MLTSYISRPHALPPTEVGTAPGGCSSVPGRRQLVDLSEQVCFANATLRACSPKYQTPNTKPDSSSSDPRRQVGDQVWQVCCGAICNIRQMHGCTVSTRNRCIWSRIHFARESTHCFEKRGRRLQQVGDRLFLDSGHIGMVTSKQQVCTAELLRHGCAPSSHTAAFIGLQELNSLGEKQDRTQ